VLDPPEIRVLLQKQLGHAPSDQHYENFMAKFDGNEDGGLSLDEYIANIFTDKYFLVDGKPHEYRTRGCTIARTEVRASSMRQLRRVRDYVQRVLLEKEFVDDNQYSATNGQRIVMGMVNMYHLCDHFIKPITKPFQCSWVELVATHEQPPQYFASHAWSTCFVETMQLLEWHAQCQELGEDARYWIW